MICIGARTWEVVPFEDRDARTDDRIMFPVGGSVIRMCNKKRLGESVHIAHGDHVIDLRYSQPVKNVGHESLESHILDPCYQFSRLEVFVGGVPSSLP